MIKTLKIIVIVIFSVLLLLPSLFFNFTEDYSKNEKRDLKQFPKFTFNALFDKSYTTELNNYFSDRYGLKSTAMNINSLYSYKLLNARGSKRVIIGKEGWYYYFAEGNTKFYLNFLKRNLFDEYFLNTFTTSMKKRQQWCENNGIKFLLIICPDKHTIYPEYYSIPQPKGKLNFNLLDSALTFSNVNYIYSPDLLKKNKSDTLLFYKQDTHWNSMGAFYYFEAVKDSIISYFPDVIFDKYNYTTRKQIQKESDLSNMLGVKHINYEYYVKVFQNFNWDSNFNKDTIINRNNIIMTNLKNDTLPVSIIYRDSFFDKFSKFTTTYFSRSYLKWKTFNATDTTEIKALKPDILIYEIVERNLTVPYNVFW